MTNEALQSAKLNSQNKKRDVNLLREELLQNGCHIKLMSNAYLMFDYFIRVPLVLLVIK